MIPHLSAAVSGTGRRAPPGASPRLHQAGTPPEWHRDRQVSRRKRAVDRDHSTPPDPTHAAPGEHREGNVQRRGIEAGEELTYHGRYRRLVQPDPAELIDAEMGGELPDRGERAGTRQHGTDRNGEYPRQWVANSASVAWVGHTGKNSEQIDAFQSVRADHWGRWHRRVWSWVGEGCLATAIPAPQATPVPHATPITPTLPPSHSHINRPFRRPGWVGRREAWLSGSWEGLHGAPRTDTAGSRGA